MAILTKSPRCETRPNGNGNGEALRFDPEEIRRLIDVGRARGLVHGAEGKAKISKDGTPVAALGAVRFQWVDITPKMAGEWLRNNFRNRPVDDFTVTAYARDMKSGNWVPTHQGIAFNDKDELIDGQHRLKAIVASGATVKMMVAFGLPSRIEGKEATTMDAVDRGRPRSVADQLKIQHGLANASMIAQNAALLSGICVGVRTRKLSVGQTLEVFREFEPSLNFVLAHRSRDVVLRSAGVLSGFAFALMPECDAGPERSKGVAPEQPKFWENRIAKLFLDLSHETKSPPAGSPVGLLKEFLVSDEARLVTKAAWRGMAELTTKAIWLDVTGKKVSKLEIGLEGIEYFSGRQRARAEKIAAMFKLPGQ